jgi:hypothetical protein
MKQAQAQAEQHRAAAEAVHQGVQRRLGEVAVRSEHILGETEAALLKSAEAAINDEVARGRREMQSVAQQETDAALGKVSGESARIAGERTAEISAAAQQAGGVAERLEAVAASAETRSKALQQQVDDAKQWLGEHTAAFQQTVHDAFLQAGGEIRGRVHAAVDSADEMIRQKSKDVMAGVEAASAQHVQALARQAEHAQNQVAETAGTATSATETLLQSRLAETLELFRTDAERLAESALSRWQSAMDETLRAIPDLLKNKLAGSNDPAVNAAHGTSAGKS